MAELYAAVVSGDFQEIDRLLGEGDDINCLDEVTGLTPLREAMVNPKIHPDMISFLIERGADVGAGTETLEIEERPEIAQAIEAGADVDTIRLLLQNGADISYCSQQGYTLMTLAAYRRNSSVIELLLELGAPLDGVSTYGESALSVLARVGKFADVAKLLAHGADPAPLRWSPLHHAVALATLEEVSMLLNGGADLEQLDFWERTPFLLSLQVGDISKAALLLERGANRNGTGRCARPATHYPIMQDHAPMLQWLLDQGLPSDQKDEFGNSALLESVKEDAFHCFNVLLAAGANYKEQDPYGHPIIASASHPGIVGRLIALGEDAAQLPTTTLRNWIGLGTIDNCSVSECDFLANRTRRFGNANPERMNNPYWDAMVRCGWSGYAAARQFDGAFERESCSREPSPVWCHERFGMSLTKLQDGRFIQIAGEHEDHYDPDFCIYNDVFIHDGSGNFEILGYPEDVFPPTDFHSATLVPPWIYIIGNLGYPETQDAHGFETPVYRLNVDDYHIERITTHGHSPGWIHKHRAEFRDGSVHISGGEILAKNAEGKWEIINLIEGWTLDLTTLQWRQENEASTVN